MNDYEQRIYDKIHEHYEAVYLIDNEKKTYKLLRGTDFWNKTLAEEGNSADLFSLLFTRNMELDKSETDAYSIFFDENFFLKENSQGIIKIPIGGERREVLYQLTKISDTQAGFVIHPFDEVSSSDKVEREKIDTIQEQYLFSMIVDLKKDSCINSNTTEVGVSSQNYMELKYSDWRNMISNMFLPEDRNMFFMITSPEYIIRQLEQNKRFKTEIQMLNMAGKYVWVRLSFNRMKGFSRENPRFVYAVRDVDQEMQRLFNQENIVKAIEEKNAQLQRADQAKSKFISNMSHEIRTPINAILGMNEMILRDSKDEQICSYAHDIKTASKLLLSIINDILDFSKIESGNMEIISSEYEPGAIIREVYNLISVRLKEKGLEFEWKVDKDIPSKLYGDEIRITQILTNILTNAVKYTERGKITLSVGKQSLDNGNIKLLVCVEDTGIGMKAEEMDKLFSAFGRLDAKRNRNIEGTGLGMSIVTRLLEQMGSKLEVESEYGVGSKFSFALEQEIVDANPIGNFLLEDGVNASYVRDSETIFEAPEAAILAVDDNMANLKVIKSLLKETQAKVALASSGEQALKIINKMKFDLILMDHFMPEMDGVDTLREIRKMGEQYSKIPVVALTANVFSGAKEYYVGQGFCDYLEKPIDTAKLNAILRTYLSDDRRN